MSAKKIVTAKITLKRQNVVLIKNALVSSLLIKMKAYVKGYFVLFKSKGNFLFIFAFTRMLEGIINCSNLVFLQL